MSCTIVEKGHGQKRIRYRRHGWRYYEHEGSEHRACECGETQKLESFGNWVEVDNDDES